MSTLLIPSSDARVAALSSDWKNNIMVAADGRTPADVALLAARKFAGDTNFGVVAVLPNGSSTDRVRDGVQTVDALRASVSDQIARMLGENAETLIQLRTGYPPAVLAAFAETHSVSLLVVGVGRPKVLERLLGDESTLRLARLARTPVFAVAVGRTVPPEAILIGTDFSATAMRAAKLALSIAAPDADVHLAHVRGFTGRIAPEGALRRHAEALQTGFCGRVIPVELQGDAATELLTYANSHMIDAVAIGKQGLTLAGASGLGPVATRIVRCANCSVLLAPTG